jgi:hypothetical protein
MMAYPASIVSTRYRQGASYARGTSIDPLIDEETRQKLYVEWQPGWPDKLEFPGGEYDITCEMILQVPDHELAGIFGKRVAARLREIARNGAGE